ncbi:MAG: cryptochrome/photolyase family protein [Cytophagales bacterium]|nr:cryptochrome/photolyase family protein [Cytophagales bacterium]
MNDVTLIFPHQLFKEHPALEQGRPIYTIEEWLFFRQYNFHKQKLILHRASMKFYEEYLNANYYDVRYIETHDQRNDVRILIASLARQGVLKIHIAEVADTWVLKRISNSCEKYKIELVVYTTPSFLTTQDEVTNYFNKHKTYFQTDFYKDRRKQQKILLEKDGKPVGGKWTFDAENRLKFPKKEVVPTLHFPKINKHIPEATAYVEKHFGKNYGSAAAPHYFANTFKDAEDWLQDFIHTRFQKFGDYEDAIVAKENVLHHSVLSPMLNTGLLTPQQVIDAVLQGAEKYKIRNKLPGRIHSTGCGLARVYSYRV